MVEATDSEPVCVADRSNDVPGVLGQLPLHGDFSRSSIRREDLPVVACPKIRRKVALNEVWETSPDQKVKRHVMVRMAVLGFDTTAKVR